MRSLLSFFLFVLLVQFSGGTPSLIVPTRYITHGKKHKEVEVVGTGTLCIWIAERKNCSAWYQVG